ncbi:MAG: tRNA 2-selenouridine(34) synthase MnmH [Burkholderiaceae bacterium]
MSVIALAAQDVVGALDRYDTIVDARSEAEFALDHLPGAVNWPTLDNQQREAIGTLYVQVDPFEARKRGSAIAARNIANHIECHVLSKTRDWSPLIYCWRGGQRSGSLAMVLGQIGFKVRLLQGGYKAFRAALVADTARLVPQLRFEVVCGTTGSGKTRLLGALERGGAQVLDLEGLACHRSSVLGAIPGQEQPVQKAFETRIWDVLRRFDAERPVYVESESRKVGNVTVPSALMDRMRQSACVHLMLSDSERVGLLMEDYEFFTRDVEALCERLDILSEIRGKAVVSGWKESLRNGEVRAVVEDLLKLHYDPGYWNSMQRNFPLFESARRVAPANRSQAAMDTVAQELIEGQTASMGA